MRAAASIGILRRIAYGLFALVCTTLSFGGALILVALSVGCCLAS